MERQIDTPVEMYSLQHVELVPQGHFRRVRFDGRLSSCATAFQSLFLTNSPEDVSWDTHATGSYFPPESHALGEGTWLTV